MVAEAQGVTRDNYYEMIPPKPRIVGQTNATSRLRLFGDEAASGYRDQNPADGIDDGRAHRLLQLAERFSPILRRNNVSVPHDPKDVVEGDLLLQVDSWENGRRIRSDSIPLGPAVTLAGMSNVAGKSEGEAGSDRRLASLIATAGPRALVAPVVDPDSDIDHIYFIDMPGHDPASWLAAAKRFEHRRSRIFMHPFIYEDRAASGEVRYHLVLQYWFFYPLNNSVNNHEGDWEFINIIVTTRARADAARTRDYRVTLMSRNDVDGILDSGSALDSTVIAAVEYHFHHSLLTLDYVARRIVPDENHAQHHDHGPRYVWEDMDLPTEAIADRLTVAEGRLATHPVAYIGGNYKGPAELLTLRPRFHDSFGRDSHGSYPFPGTWQTVGPLGLTEQVHGSIVPSLRADASAPWDSLLTDDSYLTYRAGDIVLLPDWERLDSLVATNADARRRFAWMLLPVHWGFPAVASLGAGTMKHVNLGNVAPLSPTYQSTWNRIGPASGHTRYVPRVLRTPVSPTTPWALLHNGWGVLNVPLAAWGLMPGYNVALLELMPWIGGALHLIGFPPTRTYTSAQLPHRFTTEGQGAFWEMGGRDFASILPGDSTNPAAARSTRVRRTVDPGARVWFSIFFHDRVALENTYSVQHSRITRDSVAANLEMRQLTGGVRYSPVAAFDESMHLYVRGGYGWLWYSANDVTIGTSAAGAPEPQGYLPTILPSRHWWPNTWYGGAGVELFSPRQAWLFGRLGYGLRVESSAYFNKLSFNAASGRGDVVARRGDLAASLIFGW